jgi:hypothetical protein
MAEKQGLLPIVNEAIGGAVQRDYHSQPNYTADLAQRLTTENPCIINFVSQMAANSSDPRGVAETALLVYKLLENQAEADIMHDKFE